MAEPEASLQSTTETFTEYRLRGQPPGDWPFYDHTTRDPEFHQALVEIHEKAHGRNWTNVCFQKREVTIICTEWTDV